MHVPVLFSSLVHILASSRSVHIAAEPPSSSLVIAMSAFAVSDTLVDARNIDTNAQHQANSISRSLFPSDMLASVHENGTSVRVNLSQQVVKHTIIDLAGQAGNQGLGLVGIAGTQSGELAALEALEVGVLVEQGLELVERGLALKARVRVHVVLHLGQALRLRHLAPRLLALVEDGVRDQPRFAHRQAVHVLEVAQPQLLASFFFDVDALACADCRCWREFATRRAGAAVCGAVLPAAHG